MELKNAENLNALRPGEDIVMARLGLRHYLDEEKIGGFCGELVYEGRSPDKEHHLFGTDGHDVLCITVKEDDIYVSEDVILQKPNTRSSYALIDDANAQGNYERRDAAGELGILDTDGKPKDPSMKSQFRRISA